MIEQHDLKPCPFCGGDAIMVKTNRCGRYVMCLTCEVRTAEYETDYWGSAYDKAVGVWNGRDVKETQDD